MRVLVCRNATDTAKRAAGAGAVGRTEAERAAIVLKGKGFAEWFSTVAPGDATAAALNRYFDGSVSERAGNTIAEITSLSTQVFVPQGVIGGGGGSALIELIQTMRCDLYATRQRAGTTDRRCRGIKWYDGYAKRPSRVNALYSKIAMHYLF